MLPFSLRTIHEAQICTDRIHDLLKLVRQTCLVTVLAEDSIYEVNDVRAIPIDDPASQMTGCVHVLRDSYRKHSMQEFRH